MLLNQIYDETLNRNNRIKEFEANVLYPRDTKSNATVSETLQKYLAVKELVSSLAKQFQTEYSGQFLNWSRSEEAVRDYAAGLPCGVTVPKKTSFERVKKTPSETSNKPKSAPEPVDFVKIQSIYSTLKPAGVSNELSHYKEKRHYDLEKQEEGSRKLYERARMGLHKE